METKIQTQTLLPINVPSDSHAPITVPGSSGCPNDCTDYYHGQCISGSCTCFGSYFGDDCSKSTCPNDCSGNGVCKDDQCYCNSEYTGKDCSKRRECGVPCSEFGICTKSTNSTHASGDICRCIAPQYSGPDCSQVSCEHSCQHGSCQEGVCVCENGWNGEQCDVNLCPENCSGRGKCGKHGCECVEGYTGNKCELRMCVDPCEHGFCNNGTCVCHDGWTGPSCNHKMCDGGCGNSMQGHCNDGTCVCNHPYAGKNCQDKACPQGCSHHGQCNNGTCHCDPGFAFSACEIQPARRRSCSLCCVSICMQTCGYMMLEGTASHGPMGVDQSVVNCYTDCTGQCVAECYASEEHKCHRPGDPTNTKYIQDLIKKEIKG